MDEVTGGEIRRETRWTAMTGVDTGRAVAPGIVTPEAVVLAFDTAGLGSRVVGALIDLSVQGAAFLLVVLAFTVPGRTPLGLAGVFIGFFVIAFVYPVAIETLWRGKSIGKAAMGLRVVTVEGAPIRFRHALVRGAVGLVDFWLSGGAVAVLTVLLTPRNQRLGDLAAGTLVLRERTGARVPSAATFWVPPGWEPYAATIDVSALSSRHYQAVRAFLLRAPSLDAWTRDRIAREIAAPILVALRHRPPPEVWPELFVLCVAARYQERQRQAGAWMARGSGTRPAPPGAPAVPAVAVAAGPGGPPPSPADRAGDGDGFVAPG